MKLKRRRRDSDRSLYEICQQQIISSLKTCQVKDTIVIAVTAFFIFIILVIIILTSRVNQCNGKQILQKLCEEYRRNEISGSMCYRLCIDRVIHLTNCINDQQHFKTFLTPDNLLIRAPVSLLHPDSQLKLPVGLSIESFTQDSSTYLTSRLGHSSSSYNHQDLINRLLQFADFNENKELSLGEVQSLWQLMNNEEFLLLYLFHKQSAMLNINGTCGSLYGLQFHHSYMLYDKEKRTILSSLSENAYRWGLPAWKNRVKVVLGLLELADGLAETEGVRFYLCNIKPNKLGHTADHEVVLSDLSELKSSKMIADIMSNKTCGSDGDCVYTRYCQSTCDLSTGKCTGNIIQPTLWYICDIVRDYLLYDTVQPIHYDLKRYLDKCMEVQPGMMGFSAFLADFRTFLWEFINIE
ncbi:divergent protein kinase domain 1A [Patella vulgata]|uniref:divergent protein kinase domain 1A n=1 Tax=Patella vulgata TaxID=6465 RepID=UPI00217FB6C6|nr:divergent protein kinase domain 1A [Patella vulgata]XP_050389510.1 divergent protein kinase domain 1A [Patella vulgata]